MANFSPTYIKNQYLAFDALELRNKIIQRLNQGKVFTDQNYQGSNLSSIIDVISYAFGTLLYYNSKSSSESMFSDANIYENMNRIVKILNYNPIGRISQNVSFSITAGAGLGVGSYLIPRFSYLQASSSTYSISEDLAFSKTTTEEELIESLNNNQLIHQGSFEEYPTQTAVGIEDEVIFLTLADNIYVDHFNIFVYVKPVNGKWEEWSRVSDRSLMSSTDRCYEVRFNANKKYEITFGDDINGVKLNTGDQVAIYYLHIDNNAPALGPNALNANNLIPYNSIRFAEILSDTKKSFGTYVSSSQMNQIKLDNAYGSSSFTPEESVDSIRKNAPKIFRTQHRLVTTLDYEYFIQTTFGTLLANAKVLNNDSFIKSHIKYLYDIGLKNPQLENHVLFSQIKFANACNYNNLYVYCVPNRDIFYLNSAQKELIYNEISNYKSALAEIIITDPEYMYFDFYVKTPLKNPSVDDLANNKLKIFKTQSTKRADSAIKFDVINLIKSFFDKQNVSLGQNFNMHELTTQLLAIDGVKSIQTSRTDAELFVKEVSFLVWNAKFPNNDAQVYTQSIDLEDFKYPLLFNPSGLNDRIEIVSEGNLIKVSDF